MGRSVYDAGRHDDIGPRDGDRTPQAPGPGRPIDVSPLVEEPDGPDAARVAQEIDRACRRHGFFSIVGHGVDPSLRTRLQSTAEAFFELDPREKALVSMSLGGRAWRGWFPPGGELTSGRPDSKEGLYFGTELAADDERVLEGRWLHGPNLWPARPQELRATVLEWMAEMARVARVVLGAMAVGIGLDRDWFDTNLTADPIMLFRIFHYLPLSEPATGGTGVSDTAEWGVGEHTDYGLLTLLAQDDIGGLEVRIDDRWVPIEPVRDSLVCNMGDMLDRMTGGRYRSTVHRVRAPVDRSRYSFPFFFDPGWDAEVRPIPFDGGHAHGPRPRRWDGSDLAELSGTYGEYLTTKVSRVFPDLAQLASTRSES